MTKAKYHSLFYSTHIEASSRKGIKELKVVRMHIISARVPVQFSRSVVSPALEAHGS